MVIACHYDSLLKPEGFLGATDSAVPCAQWEKITHHEIKDSCVCVEYFDHSTSCKWSRSKKFKKTTRMLNMANTMSRELKDQKSQVISWKTQSPKTKDIFLLDEIGLSWFAFQKPELTLQFIFFDGEEAFVRLSIFNLKIMMFVFFQVSKIKSHLQAESVACMLAILAWISWNSPASKIFQYSRKSESVHFLFWRKSNLIFGVILKEMGQTRMWNLINTWVESEICQGSVVCACCQVWFFFIRFHSHCDHKIWWRPRLGEQSAIYQGPVVCACWFD